jgi:DNA-binding response OmpR family regulator
MKTPLVLVLEDEALIGIDLELSLTDAGFTVVLAASCAEADRVLADQRPDAAVLDVQLRDGDCVAVAKTLVAQGVPFIVHSASHIPDQDIVFRSGTIVRKPTDTPTIVQVVRSMLAGT